VICCFSFGSTVKLTAKILALFHHELNGSVAAQRFGKGGDFVGFTHALSLGAQIHCQTAAYAVCTERATFKTFKTEFFPPKGLGTDSVANGSVIQCPSTTKQYS
jgi:hypothetical protein